jgi:hypothetical protein
MDGHYITFNIIHIKRVERARRDVLQRSPKKQVFDMDSNIQEEL